MDRNNGPTVFDINKPRTYGASPGSRPVITGHQPMMPDPMVTPQEILPPDGSKISVKVDELSNPPAAVEGEPQLSPAFRPDGDPASAAQRAPYMPVSDLTGISPTGPAPKSSYKDSDDRMLTTDPKPSVYGSSNNSPMAGPKPPDHRKSRAKLWLLTLLVLLLVLAGVYAAVDKGLIFSNVNLPFHIFKQSEPVAAPAPASPSSLAVPSGFTATKLVEANAAFAYPTTWGAPTAATDQGFSKRAASAKPDVNYAFLVNFPSNKDVQIAITSAKYLPPARATQYYDFLGWCVGSVDANFYVGVLRFSTKDGTDTPTTVTCDQGPLNNIAKLNTDTIVQTNIKNTDGSLLGDVYSKNLHDKSYVVARVKDATMKNGDLIKTMLDTIKSTQ